MVESFLNAFPCCRLANILKSDSVTGTCQGISWVYYLLAPRHSTKLQRKKYLEGVLDVFWTSYVSKMVSETMTLEITNQVLLCFPDTPHTYKVWFAIKLLSVY